MGMWVPNLTAIVLIKHAQVIVLTMSLAIMYAQVLSIIVHVRNKKHPFIRYFTVCILR